MDGRRGKGRGGGEDLQGGGVLFVDGFWGGAFFSGFVEYLDLWEGFQRILYQIILAMSMVLRRTAISRHGRRFLYP